MPIRLTVGAGFAVLCGVILTLATFATPVHAQGQGNSAAAKQCQQGGWKGLTTAGGQPFKNQGECASYAAHGGTLLPDTLFARECVARGGTFADGGEWRCTGLTYGDDIDYVARLCGEAGGTPSGDYVLPDGQVISIDGVVCTFPQD